MRREVRDVFVPIDLRDLDQGLASVLPVEHPDESLRRVLESLRDVKARHLVAAKADEAALLEQFRSGTAPALKAAE